jgi:hypothetical protein
MKTIGPFAFVVTIAFSVIGCSKSATSPTNNNSNTNTATLITSGAWKITAYTQKTEDKTANFDGIDFTFKSDGTLQASGANTASGSWAYAAAVSNYYSNSASSPTLTINLGNSSPFNRISKTWDVGDVTASTIKLSNHEVAEDEHVTFTKK